MRSILIFSCPDQAGIQSKVTNLLFKYNCFITDVDSFSNTDSETFFSRIFFKASSIKELKSEFKLLANNLKMSYMFKNPNRKLKVAILVSHESHCLNDLIYRSLHKDLNIDIKTVISNHTNVKQLVKKNNIPFNLIDTKKFDKEKCEIKINQILKSKRIELVILARYMQIMSEDFVNNWSGKCINIHHSFLPSFKGARPYHQAYQKGVKMIGATAHYVTKDLDEGQIIEQGIEEINHKNSIDDLVSKGNDIECRVLSRAIKYHSEHRVFINQNKTIVFK